MDRNPQQVEYEHTDIHTDTYVHTVVLTAGKVWHTDADLPSITH